MNQASTSKNAFEFEADVPARYLHGIRAKLNTANNKLRKKGLPGFEMEVGEPQSKTVQVEMEDKIVTIPVNYYHVKVTGSPFDFGKYRARGWADLSSTPPQLHDVTGKVSEAEMQRLACAECDQCKTKRNRQKMFLVDDLESGQSMQVGGECAKDIFMGLSPERVASTLSVVGFAHELAEQMERCEDDYLKSLKEGGGFESDRYAVLPREFIALTIEHLNTNEYISKSAAQYKGMPPTSGTVYQTYINVMAEQGGVPEELLAQADRVLDGLEKTIEAKADPGDFESNILQVCRHRNGHVSSQYLGYMAFMPVMHDGVMRHEIAKQSVHLGKPNEKTSMLLQYTGGNSYESVYGPGFRHGMTDEDGNEMVMFSSLSPRDFGLRKSNWFQADFTIKEHNEYRGVKQTQIKSMKVKGAWDFKPDEQTIAQDVRTREVENILGSFTKKAHATMKKIAEEANNNLVARENAVQGYMEGYCTGDNLMAFLNRWLETGVKFDDLNIAPGHYYSQIQNKNEGKTEGSSRPILLVSYIEYLMEQEPTLKEEYPQIYSLCKQDSDGDQLTPKEEQPEGEENEPSMAMR